MKHECKDMTYFLENGCGTVLYNPIFREYYINSKQKNGIITFAYCPWCSVKLPRPLVRDFFKVLEEEHDIDTNIGEYKNIKKIPMEFKSDVWWKKRGL